MGKECNVDEIKLSKNASTKECVRASRCYEKLNTQKDINMEQCLKKHPNATQYCNEKIEDALQINELKRKFNTAGCKNKIRKNL